MSPLATSDIMIVGRHVFSPITSRITVEGCLHPPRGALALPVWPASWVPKRRVPNEPISHRQSLFINALQRDCDPIVSSEPTPFSAAAASPGRRVIEPRGRRANAANLRVIISFSHHSVPEVKSTWH